MNKEEKTQYAVQILRNKAEELGRLPKKADFDNETVCFIKQKLGAWNRALESAGLKEPPEVSAKDKSRLKRERRKKLLKEQKKQMLSLVKETEENV